MSECEKIKRRFILICVWVMFVLFTVYGCSVAFERTVYISTKQKADKVYLTDFE